MPLIKKKSKVNDQIPTSSMADIAFLLLIFFLVTTIFDRDQGLQMMLPDRSPEAEIEVPPENLLFFLVQPDGSIQVRRGESPQTQTVNHRAVEGIMRQALVQNPDIIAAVQTHPEARYVDMTNVLDGIQMAGQRRISLQLLE